MQKTRLIVLYFLLVCSLGFYFFHDLKPIKKDPYQFTGNPFSKAGLAPPMEKPLEIAPKDTITVAAEKTDAALRARDFKTADAVVNDIIQKSSIKAGLYEPFQSYINQLVPKNDPALLTRLNEWVKNSSSVGALLARGTYFYNNAWFHRGTKFAKDTDEFKMYDFKTLMQRGIIDFEQIEKINPHIPYTSLRLVQMYHAADASNKDMNDLFKKVSKKYPDYFWLHATRIVQLAAKWSGSDKEQQDFTTNAIQTSLPNSPLKFLNPYLFGEQLTDKKLSFQGPDILWQQWLKKFSTEERVTKGIQDALRLNKTMDHYSFNQLFTQITDEYTKMDWGDAYIERFYQLAYEELGDDNYAYNYQYGQYLYFKAFRNNRTDIEMVKQAISYFQKAAANAENFAFPNKEDKDRQLGYIYGTLSGAFEYIPDDSEVMKYGVLAMQHYSAQKYLSVSLCRISYQQSQAQHAVDYCTYALSIRPLSGLLQSRAHYWRAMAYQKIKPDLVAAEFDAAIPDSDEQIRPAAIMTQAFFLTNEGKHEEALAVYKKYPEIFTNPDKRISAAAYNNICHDYRKLKRYKEALEACDKSISLDNRPEAQMEKQKILGLMN